MIEIIIIVRKNIELLKVHKKNINGVNGADIG